MSRPTQRLQPAQSSALRSALWPYGTVGNFRLHVRSRNRPQKLLLIGPKDDKLNEVLVPAAW
jgi:hypothetical protein